MIALVLPILLKLLPAYVFVAGGYIAKRWCHLRQDWVAKLLFYGLAPLVIFKGALFSEIKPFLLLIALSFSVSLLMVAAAGFITERFRSVLAPGTLKCAFGYFNIGWFGIPIVHALYGSAGSIVMTALYIGNMLFGNTVGFLLITSAEKTSDKKSKAGSIRKLLKVPSLYCVALAFLAHGLGFRQKLMEFEVLVFVLDFATLIMSVFGMGLVGMSVANLALSQIPWRKLGALLGARFLCALVIVDGLAAGLNRFGLLTFTELHIFLLMPFLPIAANILVFAPTTQNENDNKNAAEFVGMLLLASTLLSCLLLVSWLVLFN